MKVKGINQLPYTHINSGVYSSSPYNEFRVLFIYGDTPWAPSITYLNVKTTDVVIVVTT